MLFFDCYSCIGIVKQSCLILIDQQFNDEILYSVNWFNMREYGISTKYDFKYDGLSVF